MGTKASEALSLIGSLIPAGVIMPFGGATAPTGWLLCDGSSKLRADYPALYAAIGNAWGTADGTHFNLPDLKGRFLRGVDIDASRDPDKAVRTACNTGGNTGDNVGSVQPPAIKNNNPYVYTSDFGEFKTSSGSQGGTCYVAAGGANSGQQTAGNSLKVMVTEGTGNETRPLNANVNYIIKI